MATNNPSEPHPPDDRNRPAEQPIPGPDSAAEESWLLPDEPPADGANLPPTGEPAQLTGFAEIGPQGPHGGDSGVEELLPPLDTVPEADFPVAREVSPPTTEEVIDLGEPVPTAESIEPPVDPADIMADLPPAGPVAEGSGWLDPEPPASSDIFSDPGQPPSAGSDVLRSVTESPVGKSVEFDDPLEGSSRFDRPQDATENVADAAHGGMGLPSSHLFEGEYLASDGGSGVRFEDLDASPGGSNLFGDITDADINLGASGVDMLHPEQGPDTGPVNAGPGSSIFDMNVDEASAAISGGHPAGASDVGRLDALTADDVPAVGGGTSHIFADPGKLTGPAPSDVLYDLPAGDEPDLPADGTGEGGKIDWSLPPASDQHEFSDQLGVVPGEDIADGPGLSALSGSPADTPIDRSPSTRPVRPAAVTPVEPPPARRVEPPPRKTEPVRNRPTDRRVPAADRSGGGLVGWIAGAAVGFSLAAGVFAATYFTGVIPNGDSAAPVRTPTGDGVNTRLATEVEELRQQVQAKDREATDARSAAQKAETARKTAEGNLNTIKSQLTAARQSATKADQAAKKFEQEAAKAVKEKQAAEKSLLAAKVAAEEKAREVESASARAKASDAALDRVVKDLKAAKLMDEKDDAGAVLAKLPDVLRKVSAATASADARKAAEALEEARKQLDAVRAEATKAKADAAAAEKSLAQAWAEAKAAQDKLTDAQTAQRALLTRAEKAEQEAAARVEQVELMRQQLADARSGLAAAPLTDRDLATREQAAGMFGTAVELYFGGRYVAAEAALDRATKADPADARYWYFLGLTRWQQGKPTAEAAFKNGADLEARGRPNRRLVTAALERVQGPARQILAAYRP